MKNLILIFTGKRYFEMLLLIVRITCFQYLKEIGNSVSNLMVAPLVSLLTVFADYVFPTFKNTYIKSTTGLIENFHLNSFFPRFIKFPPSFK